MVGFGYAPDGRMRVRAPLGVTAYLDRPEQWAHGGAERILTRFMDRVPRRHLSFLSTSVMPEWKEIDEASLPEVLDSLRNLGVMRGIRHLFWMKLANDVGAPALGFSYTEVDPTRTERTGVLEITLPETWTASELLDIALDIVETAPVCSLVGGFVFRYDVHDEAVAFNQIYRWASRYIGVDIQKAEQMAWRASGALPGSSWLTYVGASVATVAGIDLDALRVAPLQHAERRDAGDGLMFVAGERPMLGDLNRMRFPFAYAEVARLLAPWFASPGPDFYGSFYREEHSELWFRRLVDPAAWIDREIKGET